VTTKVWAVPYLSIAILVAVGVILIVVSLVRTLRAVKRFTAASTRVSSGLDESTGLLRARLAALRIAIKQRRRTGSHEGRPQVPST
jgi:uncharacterized protein YoxC